jgi:hypothetical protein
MKQLLGELVSSQLMALGLLTATVGSGYLYVNFFFQLNFELSINLFVSM